MYLTQPRLTCMSQTLRKIVRRLGGNPEDIPAIVDIWFIRSLLSHVSGRTDLPVAFHVLDYVLKLPDNNIYNNLRRKYVALLTQERASYTALKALEVVAQQDMLQRYPLDYRLDLAVEGANEDGWQGVSDDEENRNKVRKECEEILEYLNIPASKARELYLLQYCRFLAKENQDFDARVVELVETLLNGFFTMKPDDYERHLSTLSEWVTITVASEAASGVSSSLLPQVHLCFD